MLASLDQVYAQRAGIPLRFDLFRPETGEQVPLVICIHGGGWISGEKEGMREVAISLADNGFAAVCPEYRLAPLHPFPAAVDDILAFTDFMAQNSSHLNIDPKRIATMGNSAGGHLAVMAGLRSSNVAAVVDICGITDLTNPRDQHFDISWSFIDQFLPDATEETYKAASPMTFVTEKSPPFLIVHGINDDIVPIAQSDTLAEALRAKGVPFEYHQLEGESHGFSIAGWLQIEGLMMDFLSRQFAPQASAERPVGA